MVQKQDDSGEWVDVTAKEEMEAVIIQENQRKYLLMAGTPLVSPPLVDDFGYMGVTEAARAILEGTYQIPPGVNEYTTDLLHQLCRDPRVLQRPPILTSITNDQYVEAWRRQKEDTSSGPSGMHFGIFKAGTYRPYMAEFDASMLSFPLETGHSPSCWC
jgi:hypothetical protein